MTLPETIYSCTRTAKNTYALIRPVIHTIRCVLPVIVLWPLRERSNPAPSSPVQRADQDEVVQRRRLQAQAHLQDVVVVRRDSEQGHEAVDE